MKKKKIWKTILQVYWVIHTDLNVHCIQFQFQLQFHNLIVTRLSTTAG